MPQLNPAPWFITLFALWILVFLVMKPVVLNLQSTPNPALNLVTNPVNPWAWLWQ